MLLRSTGRRLGLLALSFCLAQASALDTRIAAFIPAGQRLVDAKAVDLDSDGLSDRVLILESIKDSQAPRTLLVLRGTRTGFSEMARNTNVVFCRGCGGVYGDPYNGMVVRQGEITVHNYGGTNWRWVSEFSFGLVRGEWKLTSHTLFSSSPDGQETETSVPPGECQNSSLVGFVCGVQDLRDYVVTAGRASFYREPKVGSRQRAYVIAGQTVRSSLRYRTFIMAFYEPTGPAEPTRGYIRLSDVRPR